MCLTGRRRRASRVPETAPCAWNRRRHPPWPLYGRANRLLPDFSQPPFLRPSTLFYGLAWDDTATIYDTSPTCTGRGAFPTYPPRPPPDPPLSHLRRSARVYALEAMPMHDTSTSPCLEPNALKKCVELPLLGVRVGTALRLEKGAW